jgi:hypothetical protein
VEGAYRGSDVIDPAAHLVRDVTGVDEGQGEYSLADRAAIRPTIDKAGMGDTPIMEFEVIAIVRAVPA